MKKELIQTQNNMGWKSWIPEFSDVSISGFLSFSFAGIMTSMFAESVHFVAVVFTTVVAGIALHLAKMYVDKIIEGKGWVVILKFKNKIWQISPKRSKGQISTKADSQKIQPTTETGQEEK